MTNKEYILSLSNEELAELLIKIEFEKRFEYDRYGNKYPYYQRIYLSPDENEYCDYNKAISKTAEWLDEDVKVKKKV